MIYISQVILQIFHSLQKRFAADAVRRRNKTRRK